MEITYASPSSIDLLRSSSAVASGSTMPVRPIKIIPLQHPDTTSYGSPGGVGNSSSSFWSNSLFSGARWKIKRMTFIDWIEMFLPCCRWIRTYRWREYLQVDLMAGTTVGIMLVPQAMSYAKLAGLDPIYGLSEATPGPAIGVAPAATTAAGVAISGVSSSAGASGIGGSATSSSEPLEVAIGTA